MKRNPGLLGLTLTVVVAWGAFAWFDTAPEAVALQHQPDIFSFVQPLQQNMTAVPATADAEAHPPHADIASLKRMFDYHLLTASEKAVADIRLEIHKELIAAVPAAQATAARELLDRYLGYKTALVTRWRVGASTIAEMQANMLAMRELRARYFDEAEAHALFADDDAADDHQLARLQIMQDHSLSEEAKDARLLELDTAATPRLQQARDEREGVIRLRNMAVPDSPAGNTDDGVYRLTAMGVPGQAQLPGPTR